MTYQVLVSAPQATVLDPATLAALDPSPVIAATPQTFEALGQAFGYVLYQAVLIGTAQKERKREGGRER